MPGIGDSIFWDVLRLLAASITISFGATGSILAPFLFLAIYNIPQIICRYYLTYAGFTLGTNSLSTVQKTGTMKILTKNSFDSWIDHGRRMGASTVTFACKLSILVEGSNPILIQTYLDSFFKGLVPLI